LQQTAAYHRWQLHAGTRRIVDHIDKNAARRCGSSDARIRGFVVGCGDDQPHLVQPVRCELALDHAHAMYIDQALYFPADITRANDDVCSGIGQRRQFACRDGARADDQHAARAEVGKQREQSVGHGVSRGGW
jgi:hypothetical protein